MHINTALIVADNISDYVPFVSTVTNLVDLFLKTVVLPHMQKQNIWNNHYYTHLSQKNLYRSVALLVPILGNIVVAIYDFVNRKYDNENLMQEAVRKDASVLQHVSEKLKNNWIIVLTAVRKNASALQYASERLRNNGGFIREVFRYNGQMDQLSLGDAFQYVSDDLKSDRETVSVAVQGDGIALQFADRQFQDDEEIVLAAISSKPCRDKYRNAHAFQFASERLKNNRGFALRAVRLNGLVLMKLKPEFKNDREITHAAVLEDSWALELALDRYKSDRGIVLEAVGKYFPRRFSNGISRCPMSPLEFADESLRNDPQIRSELERANPNFDHEQAILTSVA